MYGKWYKIHDNVIDLRANFEPLSSPEAAKITIEHIMENYPPPYNIMVSGGIDSQAMLYAWKLFGKDYIPISVRYNTDLNSYDLTTLQQFSKQENINIHYLNFDLLKFYETLYPKVCEKYECSSPQFATYLAMTQRLSGTVIFGGDRLTDSNSRVIWSKNVCLLNASKVRNIVPYFFMETPELAYSGIHDQLIFYNQSIPNDSIMPSSHEERHALMYDLKWQSWRQIGFPILKQKNSYTGFEQVKDYYDTHCSHMVPPKIKLKFSHRLKVGAYNMALVYPYETKFGIPEYSYLFNEPLSSH